ncbi:serine/threonine-protein kinase [Actinomadura geliboluensis]|uniref:non-specific serine/threonine protein kinase n=1 Tax=Actinomadura geliboluensis TaxID=882440 RepID=A0A5S4G2Y8_9ACTN|nr:serine/threonine-protein kinase [Actinomadura geliboluensis]TMR27319.1 serine/threonine protein kinase [Actinomadura geliboluensis]
MLAGRYRNLGKIGQGGMGSVWRAHDPELGREVAIKELRVPEQVTEQERSVWYARMEREARAAARLRHPGVVTVYDRVVDEDGRPWIVMELLQGLSLERLLADQGVLPARQVAAIGLAMLDALSAAHAQGIVHRDVKPANVLLESGRVVLTDFGIAAVEGDATLTRSGAVLGTPAYMSPEQVHGQTATPASDLWALGATLYRAVEGRTPFTAPSHGALFIAIATGEPAPPQCGGPLARLLDGLLRKDPADRPSPAQARELLNAVAEDGERPLAQDRQADPDPATRIDPTLTGNGARGARGAPVAVRGALASAWIAAAAVLLLPRDFSDPVGLVVLLDMAPRWLVGALALVAVFSCGLWNLTRRPGLTLAAVALLNLLLSLAVPSGYNEVAINEVGKGDTPDIGVGATLGWLLGAVALMFAFAGVNKPLITRMPRLRRFRPALLRTAVITEGAVAVMWLPFAFSAWGMEMDMDMSTHLGSDGRARALVCALGVLFILWISAQTVYWRAPRSIRPGR